MKDKSGGQSPFFPHTQKKGASEGNEGHSVKGFQPIRPARSNLKISSHFISGTDGGKAG
jgi:hypothetical protein